MRSTECFRFRSRVDGKWKGNGVARWALVAVLVLTVSWKSDKETKLCFNLMKRSNIIANVVIHSPCVPLFVRLRERRAVVKGFGQVRRWRGKG